MATDTIAHDRYNEPRGRDYLANGSSLVNRSG
jgi:hypothetical protein